jgi:hypothetical protein
LTTKELTEIVTKHDVTISEINHALAHITHNSLILHDSIKSLEVTALAHDAQIEELIESGKKLHEDMAELKQQFQAYLTTRQN